MARSFPGGASDTDKVLVTRYPEVDNLAALSISVWTYRTGAGGAGAGRAVMKPGGFYILTGTSTEYFQAERWSGSGGVWHITTPSLNVWHHIVWTYSYSALSNVPTCYVDGEAVGVTLDTAPTGTATDDDSAGHVAIGNDAVTLRCWQGRLAEPAIWNRVLTADEARFLYALAANAPQDTGALATGLVLYVPLDGTSSPEPNPVKPANPGVVSGTSAVASPALFVPAARSLLGWDPTQPVEDSALASAPIRQNFEALDAAVMAPVAAEGTVYTIVSGAPAWAAAGAGGGPAAIQLRLESATFPDGSGTGNAPASMLRSLSTAQTANTPFLTRTFGLFGPTTDTHLMWTFILPATYGSGGTLRLKWTINATTGAVVWKAGAGAGVDGAVDSAIPFAAADSAGAVTVPTPALTLMHTTIALTRTNWAASRQVTVFIGRDADHASDTAAADAYLLGALLEYTPA